MKVDRKLVWYQQNIKGCDLRLEQIMDVAVCRSRPPDFLFASDHPKNFADKAKFYTSEYEVY